MKTWPDSLAANSSRHRPSRASTSKTPSTTLSVRFVDTTKRCHRTRPDQARLAHAPQKARWTWASLAKTPAAAENASLCNWMWVLGFNNGRKAHKPGHEKRSLHINRNEPEKKKKGKKVEGLDIKHCATVCDPRLVSCRCASAARLVIRLCLLPYNAAIFSTNVRFPLCSLVCLFGKVVLFFWQCDERFISPEYILQVCVIFDMTCFAHLVILPACHIYWSCVIFDIYYYYFFSFSFMRILFELCLFSIHIPPNVNHPMHYV